MTFRQARRERQAFRSVRDAELAYGRRLRSIARAIGQLVSGLRPTSRQGYDEIQRMLERYADVVQPWARSVAKSMLAEVSRRDLTAWQRHSRFMGIRLRRELLEEPTGEAFQRLMDEQVHLITSLPREAARRVHELATGSLYSGARPEVIVEQIMRTGTIAEHRAITIARTETGRASTMLTQARALAIGSPGYIWRTAGDYKVRPEIGTPGFRRLNTLARGSHRKLEGTFHHWDDPPIADPSGIRAHPGSIFNCRCFPEPLLPDFEEAGRSSG